MTWTLEHAHDQVVLVPFDFTDPARDALVTARSFVARTELMMALHVLIPPSQASPAFLVGELDEDELRAHADRELAKALSEAGYGEAQRRVTIGDPAGEILDVAFEIDAALIVMPSLGKKGLRRWMLGSVTERVVRRAACPVLVLPITPDEDPDKD